MIPEKLKFYNCFDDGKVTQSRMYQVLVTDIIDRKDLSGEVKQRCDLALESDPDFWDENYEKVVIGVSYEANTPRIEIFLPIKDSTKWFGIGEYEEDEDKLNSYWCSGLLDVDGSLTKSITIEKLKFELDGSETMAATLFRNKHSECCPLMPSSGGKFSYIITPTGIGNIVKIKCNMCGEEKDITNSDNW